MGGMLMEKMKLTTLWMWVGFLAIAVSGCNVLVIMPSEAHLRLDGGKMIRVGSFLDETMVPLMALMKIGCEITVATPQGRPPIMDPRSNASHYFSSDAEWQSALHLWETLPALQLPLALADLAATDPDSPVDAVSTAVAGYDLLFIPGGHAPMIDLWPSLAAARLLLHFASESKHIAAICHGPVVLASASLLNAPWPFSGANLTVFSTPAEQVNEVRWGAKLGFYPADVLSNLGANVVQAAAYAPHVIVSMGGRLITAQNPESAEMLAETLTTIFSK